MPHVKGKWARPVVEGDRLVRPRIRLEDWQVFAFGVAFGWVHRESGLRRFRRAYLEVARKNAKSTPCAGLGLFLMAADGEPGAEVYSVATKKDQAKVVWDVAKAMLAVDPEFQLPRPAGLGIESSARSIFQEHSSSKYEPLGRDSDTQDGLHIHGFIADELHAWKDRKLYDVVDSGTGAREQPFGWMITTAGYNTGGVCFEQRQYLTRILNRTLLDHGGAGFRVEGDSVEDETFFGLIYTLDTGYADDRADDNWYDEEHWLKANPNLGVSVSIEDLRAKRDKAMASEQSQPEFRTKHCNQWLAANSAWMDMAKWDACADPALSLDDFEGEDCWAGLDAAFKTDVFAKVKVFRRGDQYCLFGSYWLPETRLDAKRNPEFWGWAEKGLIQASPGPVIDIELVREALLEDSKHHKLREVPYDPAHLTQFSSEMLDEGLPMVEMRPTVLNFSEPMKFLSELVLQGRLRHNGDPVLRWMVGNVVCHRDAKDNIYPRKPEGHEDQRKIDGVIAAIMALGRAMVNDETNGPSVYETRGLIEVDL